VTLKLDKGSTSLRLKKTQWLDMTQWLGKDSTNTNEPKNTINSVPKNMAILDEYGNFMVSIESGEFVGEFFRECGGERRLHKTQQKSLGWVKLHWYNVYSCDNYSHTFYCYVSVLSLLSFVHISDLQV